MTYKLSSVATYAAAFILAAFGFMYLLKNSFMPYHSKALSLTWDQVQPATQYLVLALMRATSGGFISTAIAIIFLQYKLAGNKLAWIPYLILVLGSTSMACSLYAIITVNAHTPGNPPIALTIVGEILLILGFVFNLKYLGKSG